MQNLRLLRQLRRPALAAAGASFAAAYAYAYAEPQARPSVHRRHSVKATEDPRSIELLVHNISHSDLVVTLSDGEQKLKCALSLELNPYVYKGWLSGVGQLVRVEGWKYLLRDDAASLGERTPPVVLLTKLAHDLGVADDRGVHERGVAFYGPLGFDVGTSLEQHACNGASVGTVVMQRQHVQRLLLRLSQLCIHQSCPAGPRRRVQQRMHSRWRRTYHACCVQCSGALRSHSLPLARLLPESNGGSTSGSDGLHSCPRNPGSPPGTAGPRRPPPPPPRTRVGTSRPTHRGGTF